MTLQRMAKQGASLQNYNNELVKSMEVTKNRVLILSNEKIQLRS